jgi:hypothetical protein
LARDGNQVAAYTSSDGSNWSLAGINTIDLPIDVFVGLAVTSHDASTLATAVFDEITF